MINEAINADFIFVHPGFDPLVVWAHTANRSQSSHSNMKKLFRLNAQDEIHKY